MSPGIDLSVPQTAEGRSDLGGFTTAAVTVVTVERCRLGGVGRAVCEGRYERSATAHEQGSTVLQPVVWVEVADVESYSALISLLMCYDMTTCASGWAAMNTASCSDAQGCVLP